MKFTKWKSYAKDLHRIQKDKDAKDHHLVQEDKDTKDRHRGQKDKDAKDRHWVQKDKDCHRVQKDKDTKDRCRVLLVMDVKIHCKFNIFWKGDFFYHFLNLFCFQICLWPFLLFLNLRSFKGNQNFFLIFQIVLFPWLYIAFY